MPMTPRCQPSPSTTRGGGGKLSVRGETRFNRGQRAGFCLAAFAIEALELVGEFAGAGRVARAEELDDF